MILNFELIDIQDIYRLDEKYITVEMLIELLNNTDVVFWEAVNDSEYIISLSDNGEITIYIE